MKRRAIWLQLQPQVVKVVLARRSQHWLVRTVAVTTQANLISPVRCQNFDAGKRYATDIGRRLAWAALLCRVWVMAISALDVTSVNNCRLRGIMHQCRRIQRV